MNCLDTKILELLYSRTNDTKTSYDYGLLNGKRIVINKSFCKLLDYIKMVSGKVIFMDYFMSK